MKAALPGSYDTVMLEQELRESVRAWVASAASAPGAALRAELQTVQVIHGQNVGEAEKMCKG